MEIHSQKCRDSGSRVERSNISHTVLRSNIILMYVDKYPLYFLSWDFLQDIIYILADSTQDDVIASDALYSVPSQFTMYMLRVFIFAPFQVYYHDLVVNFGPDGLQAVILAGRFLAI